MYKVLIRPLEVSDALSSYKWRNDSEIWKYTGSRPDIEITPEIEIEWIKNALKDSYSKRFAITANDKYIGNVQLTNINEGQAEYHIFIGDKDFWGKGIAFSATKQIIRYAKNVLHLEKIFLRVKNQNKKAVSLYEDCGFEFVSELDGEVTMSIALEKPLVTKVSIFCMVYNHQPYLKECLEGFLMQQCTFDFEIVIGEDFSTDNSRGLILEYANKYPGKFKLLLHDKNIGALRNQRLVFENCIGEYIAMCEGDDYWTDPLKLQKQVDFLEVNPEYSMCFHDVHEEFVDINCEKAFGHLQEREYTSYEILKKWTVPTASVVFRNFDFFSYKSLNDSRILFGDIVLFLTLAELGKIKCISNKPMAVYRRFFGSATNSATNIEYVKKLLLHNEFLEENFAGKMSEIDKIFRDNYFQLNLILFYKIFPNKMSYYYLKIAYKNSFNFYTDLFNFFILNFKRKFLKA